MNDKILSIAILLMFVMIGVNGFLLMASQNLYDNEGRQLNIYYGMDDSFGSNMQTKADGTTIDSGVSISSEVPSQQQGLIVATNNGTPTGLDFTTQLYLLGNGVQLVMLKFSTMFPVLSPLVNVFVFFAYALQFFVIAYLTSILVRGILGRIT